MAQLNNQNFAIEAENVIKSLIVTDRKGNTGIKITTSKIRNLLAMVNVIYNQALKLKEDKLTAEITSNLQYTKMKFAYEAGREPEVKNFLEKARLMENIDAIGNSKEQLMIFCKYMESLVAYHRFHGGKERK